MYMATTKLSLRNVQRLFTANFVAEKSQFVLHMCISYISYYKLSGFSPLFQ